MKGRTGAIWTPIAAVAVAAAVAAGGATAAAAKLDVCKLVTKKEAAAVLGAGLLPAQATPPSGSALGGCNYVTTKGKGAAIVAQPSAEFTAYAAVVRGSAISGLKGKAYWSKSLGLIVQPRHKPYFLHVIGFSAPGQLDKALSVAIAKKALN